MKQESSLMRLKLFQLNSKIKQAALLDKTLERFHKKAMQLQLHIEEQEKSFGISDPKHYTYPPSAKDTAIRRAKLLISTQELIAQRNTLITEIEKLQAEIEKLQQKLLKKYTPAAYKTA